MFSSNVRETELNAIIKKTTKEKDSISKLEKLIKKGVDVNAPGISGKTPLHCAAQRNLPLIIAFLLKNKADPDKKDDYGDKPIHAAANNDAGLALQALVNSNPAQLTAQGRNARTAFWIAVMENNYNAMTTLIQLGAEINQLDFQTKQSAMHYAVQQGNKELLKFLVQNKASKEIVNRDGFTPLELATLMNANEMENILNETAGNTKSPGNNMKKF